MTCRSFFQTIFCSILLSGILPAHADTFDRQKEFPNYFVAEQFRSLPPDKIPEAEVKRARAVMEGAIGSIFDRLTLPVVPEGESQARQIRYFEHVSKELLPSGSSVKIVPSGGVVRSAVGYLYSKIRDGLRADPAVSAEETLKRITESKDPIPAIDIRGVGSDFDLLVISKDPNDPAIAKVLQLTDSTSKSHETSGLDKTLKSTFFALADVKDYRAQIERSTQQGGRTLDFLAFDVQQKRFIEPPQISGIVDDLVRGQNAYVRPIKVEPENAIKQTIRGMRMYLELPWLAEKSEQQLRSELQGLLNQVRSGADLKSYRFMSAIDQFAKMLRNSRYSGAHNRFYRAPPGSVDALFKELSDALRERRIHHVLPEFVDSYFIDPKEGRPLNGLPRSALMSPLQFENQFTDGRVVYHGTKSLEAALSIIRQGLYISDDKQGTASFGRGGYSIKESGYAKSHSAGGYVFKLKIRSDRPVNVLEVSDLNKTKEGAEFLSQVLRRARNEGRNLHDVLARDHGIDLIAVRARPLSYATDVPMLLIQNMDAVEVPKGLAPIVDGLFNLVTDRSAKVFSRLQAFQELQILSNFAGEASGVTFPKLPLNDSIHLLEEALRARSSPVTIAGLIRSTAQQEDPRGLDFVLRRMLKRPEATVRETAISTIHGISPSRILPYLSELLSHPNSTIFEESVRCIAEKKINRPDLISLIKQRIESKKTSAPVATKIWAGLIPETGLQSEALEAASKVLQSPESHRDLPDVILRRLFPTLPKDKEFASRLGEVIQSKDAAFSSFAKKTIRRAAFQELLKIDGPEATLTLLDASFRLDSDDAALALNEVKRRNPSLIENSLEKLADTASTREYLVREYLESQAVRFEDPRFMPLVKKVTTYQDEIATRAYLAALKSGSPAARRFVISKGSEASAVSALKRTSSAMNAQDIEAMLRGKSDGKSVIAALTICADGRHCDIDSPTLIKASNTILTGPISYDPEIAKIFTLLGSRAGPEEL